MIVKQFKLNRQIYLILIFVLGLTVVLQITRSQSILSIGGKLNEVDFIGEGETVNALNPEEVTALNEGKTLLLYDSNENFSVKVKDNAEHLLDYMKKPHEVVPAQEYQGNGQGYKSVIIAMSDLKTLPEAAWLSEFVNDGGRVLFAATPSVNDVLYSFYRKLGINELGDYAQTEGLHLISNVLIHSAGDTFSSEIVENTSLQVHLAKDAIIHATDEKEVPLLWEAAYGSGKFIVFNGTMLQEKTSRGFLAGAINMLQENDIYPVINTKLMYIDDFPAPMPVGFQKDLFEIYKRSMSRFFKEVWWPDMLRMASAHNLKFTGVVIQSYNNNIDQPFDNKKDADKVTLVTFGREVLKRGGEIGIHGYNHQSLTMDPRISKGFGYNPWNSVDDMAASIQTVKDFIQKEFPNYGVHNYVPPSNALTEEGREALKQGWPEIKSISSVYSEDEQKLSYVQEFGVASDGIIELPRITSGYKKDEFNEWAAINAASSIGVFSHFIHPDDILDRQRSFPFTWDELAVMTNDFLNLIDEKFSWLRSMTATEASAEVESYTLSEPHFVHKPDRIDGYINHYKEGDKLYYILRTSNKITREVQCKVRRIDQDVYLVEVQDEEFSIGLGG